MTGDKSYDKIEKLERADVILSNETSIILTVGLYFNNETTNVYDKKTASLVISNFILSE